MFYAVAAYVIWGFFPAFFPLLLPASPAEILAHRIVWTAFFMVAYLLITGGWRELARFDRATWGWLLAAGALITGNWGIYLIAVINNHVADAALGYFINPLVSIALGIIFLKELLRRWQAISVGIALVAVIYLTVFTGQAPWVSLTLAFTFGFYGLIKKRIKVSAAASVAAEALVVSPLALGYLYWLESSGQGTFLTEGPAHTGLLMVAGLVTAVPLLFFSLGAKRLPLSTVGMLQYISPVMQMLWAVFVTHEHFSAHRWVGFCIIFLAVAIYLTDLLRMQRDAQQSRPTPRH